MENWGQTNPFRDLNVKASRDCSSMSNSEAAKLADATKVVAAKYDQVTTILQRLEQERVWFNMGMEMLQKNTKYGPDGKGEIDERVSRIAWSYVQSSLAYELDYEDLFIHGRILLDLMALVAYNLIRDKNLKWKSFSGQRKFFLSKAPKPYPFGEYAIYGLRLSRQAV